MQGIIQFKAMNRSARRLAAVLFIILIILIPMLLSAAWGRQFADDAYPLLQAARALAEGKGVTLASGESAASPSMLFTWMVSAAARLFPGTATGPDAAGAAAVLSVLGWSAAALAFLAVGKSIQRLPGAAAGALLLCFNPIVISSAGSPASWIVALSWWAVALFLNRRYILLLVAIAALVLMTLPLPPGLPVRQAGLLSAFAWSLLLFLGGIGAEMAARRLAANMKPEIDPQRAFRLALLAIFWLAGVFQLLRLNDLFQARPQDRWALEEYVAAWLRENTESTAVIGASEKIGYLADRPSFALESLAADDTTGLLQNRLRAGPVDYLVAGNALPWRLLTDWRWFQLNYRPLAELDDAYVADAPYTIWGYQPPPAELGFAHALNARVPNRLRILGYQVDQVDLERTGEALLTLYLEAEAHTITPVRSFLVKTRLLSTLDGGTLAEWDNVLPQSVGPEEWGPGVRVREQITIDVPPDLEPGAYPLNISLADSESAEFWPISLDNDIERLDRLNVGYLVVPMAVDAAAIQEREATFGDQVKLLGYMASEPRPGEALELTLFWQVSEPLGDEAPALNVFTHILDRNGQLVANHDGVPGNGRYPTPSWMPGMTIVDTHTLTLPADLAAGSYEVWVGLYDPESGERLAVVGRDGEAFPEGALPLMEIVIADGTADSADYADGTADYADGTADGADGTTDYADYADDADGTTDSVDDADGVDRGDYSMWRRALSR
ncbi:MAG: hypothetical protein ACK2U4_22355 [Candidatus Promineifilaceae bacterium]